MHSSPQTASLNGLTGRKSTDKRTFEQPVISPIEDPVSQIKTFPNYYLPSPTTAILYPSNVQLMSFIAPEITPS